MSAALIRNAIIRDHPEVKCFIGQLPQKYGKLEPPFPYVIVSPSGGMSTGMGGSGVVAVRTVNYDFSCYERTAERADALFNRVLQGLRLNRIDDSHFIRITGGPVLGFHPELQWPTYWFSATFHHDLKQ